MPEGPNGENIHKVPYGFTRQEAESQISHGPSKVPLKRTWRSRRPDVRPSGFRVHQRLRDLRIVRTEESPLEVFEPDGYVYIVGVSERNIYKIGKASNVEGRLDRLDLQLPWPVDLVHAFPCEGCERSERSLHDMYRESRMNGEWFQLSQREVAFLKTIVRMRKDATIEVRA